MKWTKVDNCEVDKSGQFRVDKSGQFEVDILKGTFERGQKGGHPKEKGGRVKMQIITELKTTEEGPHSPINHSHYTILTGKTIDETETGHDGYVGDVNTAVPRYRVDGDSPETFGYSTMDDTAASEEDDSRRSRSLNKPHRRKDGEEFITRPDNRINFGEQRRRVSGMEKPKLEDARRETGRLIRGEKAKRSMEEKWVKSSRIDGATGCGWRSKSMGDSDLAGECLVTNGCHKVGGNQGVLTRKEVSMKKPGKHSRMPEKMVRFFKVVLVHGVQNETHVVDLRIEDDVEDQGIEFGKRRRKDVKFCDKITIHGSTGFVDLGELNDNKYRKETNEYSLQERGIRKSPKTTRICMIKSRQGNWNPEESSDEDLSQESMSDLDRAASPPQDAGQTWSSGTGTESERRSSSSSDSEKDEEMLSTLQSKRKLATHIEMKRAKDEHRSNVRGGTEMRSRQLVPEVGFDSEASDYTAPSRSPVSRVRRERGESSCSSRAGSRLSCEFGRSCPSEAKTISKSNTSKSERFRSNDEPSDVKHKLRKSPDVNNGNREIHETTLKRGIEAGWIEERRSKHKANIPVQEVQAKDDWRFRGIIGKANRMVREEPKQVHRSKECSPDTEIHNQRRSSHNQKIADINLRIGCLLQQRRK